MPPRIVRYPPIQCNTRERQAQSKIPIAPPAWRIPEGPESLAAVPMGGGGAWPWFEQTHNRASAAGVEGAGGSGGHGRASRSTTPSETRVWRSLGRPGPTAPRTPAVPQATKQQGQGVGGPGCGTHGRRQGLAGLRGEAPPHTATQAPPVRRAPEGPEGQGGLRDRPLRAKGSRVAISRAAGPDGAQNTSGAAKQPGPDTRKPRPADAGRGQPTQSGGKV